MNYLIVLFKNKIKKKIINKFKTHKKSDDLFITLSNQSNDVIFEKKYTNGDECNYELAILEKSPDTFLPVYLKDELGRQIKVNLDDGDYTITKIITYKIEETLLDTTLNKKINSHEFIKLYLDPVGFKLMSKLNNKIIVQNDDKVNLFILKNEYDSSRFIESISNKFISEKRMDCMFIKDCSTPQKKSLYNLLINQGFSKDYLLRYSTTHPVKK
jgi:hypothetical protein